MVSSVVEGKAVLVSVGRGSSDVSCAVTSVAEGDGVSVGVGGGVVSVGCVVNGRCCVVVRVVRHALPLDDCVESVVVVGGVLDHPDGSVGFVEAVGTLDRVTVPRLPLALEVAGLAVAHSVVEVVLGVGLGMEKVE